MPDIDGDHMACPALQQDLGEAAGRRAEIKRQRPGWVETESIQPGNQLERGARDIAAGRVIDREVDSIHHFLPRFGRGNAANRNRSTQNGVTCARAALEQAALDEQFVQPHALGIDLALHPPSMTKGAIRRKR